MKLLCSLFLVSTLFAQSISLKSHTWNATGWKIRSADLSNYGNSSPRLSNAPDGSLVFDFPVDNGTGMFSSINYLTTKFNGAFGSQLTYTLSVASTSAPVFNWFTEPGQCDTSVSNCNPAAARPYFESSFNGTCASGQSSVWCNRWWSVASYYILAPGSVTLVIPLDPSKWSTVNGYTGVQESAAWAYALHSPSQIGLTFGGGYFYGHGIYVTGGTAQFQLQGLATQ